jgi:hypothetical protein
MLDAGRLQTRPQYRELATGTARAGTRIDHYRNARH